MPKVITNIKGLENDLLDKIGLWVNSPNADRIRAIIDAHAVDMPDVVEREAALTAVVSAGPLELIISIAEGNVKALPSWTGKAKQ